MLAHRVSPVVTVTPASRKRVAGSSRMPATTSASAMRLALGVDRLGGRVLQDAVDGVLEHRRGEDGALAAHARHPRGGAGLHVPVDARHREGEPALLGLRHALLALRLAHRAAHCALVGRAGILWGGAAQRASLIIFCRTVTRSIGIPRRRLASSSPSNSSTARSGPPPRPRARPRPWPWPRQQRAARRSASARSSRPATSATADTSTMASTEHTEPVQKTLALKCRTAPTQRSSIGGAARAPPLAGRLPSSPRGPGGSRLA